MFLYIYIFFKVFFEKCFIFLKRVLCFILKICVSGEATS
jgi:hypothetical protein